jgi:terminase small subunit-like protein
MPGRPSSYSPEIAQAICGHIASSNDSLKAICESDESLPEPRTVYRWLAAHPEFGQMYARAKEIQCHAIAEGIREIAADGRNDWMERLAFHGGSPGWEINGECVNRSKLRVDTDKWLLSKLMPRKYGEKLELEAKVTTESTEAAQLAAVLTPEELELIRQRVSAK